MGWSASVARRKRSCFRSVAHLARRGARAVRRPVCGVGVQERGDVRAAQAWRHKSCLVSAAPTGQPPPAALSPPAKHDTVDISYPIAPRLPNGLVWENPFPADVCQTLRRSSSSSSGAITAARARPLAMRESAKRKAPKQPHRAGSPRDQARMCPDAGTQVPRLRSCAGAL
jgi:hypothetical protein